MQSVPAYIPLDNSALIYPPTQARYNPGTFRLSIDLTIAVDQELLLVALKELLPRFPYYQVALEMGFFSYYLTPNAQEIEVYAERAYPCGYFNRKRSANNYLFKVFYWEKRIAIEFFHALTDGSGALIFLKSLVAHYLRLKGVEVGPDDQIFLPSTEVDSEEWSDSFQKFYQPLRPVKSGYGKAFHLKRGEISDRVRVVQAKVATESVKRLAKEYDSTITEYLVSELLAALQRVQQESESKPKRYQPLRISVPVNMRRIYPSKSMRNFTLFVIIGIDPRLGVYSFAEIIHQVRHQMRASITAKDLSRQIARNVSGQRNLLIRYTPTLLKNPFMKVLSYWYGERLYSSTISNLGEVSLPTGMAEHVSSVDFYLAPSVPTLVSLGVIGAQGVLTLNLSSLLLVEPELERQFLSALVQKGLAVEVASNLHTVVQKGE